MASFMPKDLQWLKSEGYLVEEVEDKALGQVRVHKALVLSNTAANVSRQGALRPFTACQPHEQAALYIPLPTLLISQKSIVHLGFTEEKAKMVWQDWLVRDVDKCPQPGSREGDFLLYVLRQFEGDDATTSALRWWPHGLAEHCFRHGFQAELADALAWYSCNFFDGTHVPWTFSSRCHRNTSGT